MHLLSRKLKDLSPSFPELICAGDALAPGTLVDGERINAPVDLANQSEFQIGGTTIMLIVTDEG